jgi:hypothetical protein
MISEVREKVAVEMAIPSLSRVREFPSRGEGETQEDLKSV